MDGMMEWLDRTPAAGVALALAYVGLIMLAARWIRRRRQEQDDVLAEAYRRRGTGRDFDA